MVKCMYCGIQLSQEQEYEHIRAHLQLVTVFVQMTKGGQLRLLRHVPEGNSLRVEAADPQPPKALLAEAVEQSGRPPAPGIYPPTKALLQYARRDDVTWARVS
jgi:hypothetical protein